MNPDAKAACRAALLTACFTYSHAVLRSGEPVMSVDLDDAAACMADREATLREVLQQLEWCKERAGWTGPVACCPACFGPRFSNFLGYEIEGEPQYEAAGHRSNCWLRAALAAAQEE